LFEFEKFPETSLRRKFIGGDLRRNTEAPISQFRDELASAIVSVHPIKMNGGPSGFNNAPVTKAFVIATALFTVFFGIRGGSSKLGLSYQVISHLILLYFLLSFLIFKLFWVYRRMRI
jgi:hypothetical protein